MAERLKLTDICLSINNGERPPVDIENGSFPYINAGTIPSGFFNKYNSEKNAITTPSHGEGGIGYVGFQKDNFWCGALCFKIYADVNKALSKFLYYSLSQNYNILLSLKKEGGVPYINRSQIQNIEILVPPISEQRRIVDILDKFEGMVENVEKELELRQKQYEYYREKMIIEDNKDAVRRKIKDVALIYRGNGLQKKDFTSEGIGCIHYGQIYTKLGFSLYETLTYVSRELASKLTKVSYGNLVVACTSENVEDVCKAVVWLGDNDIVTGGHACVLKHCEDPKYFAHCFKTHDFALQKAKFALGAKVIDINKNNLGSIEIPIPSMPKQQEIVTKLDKFEEMITTLKKELELRKKQYEYYREKLLTFA